jgi:two-component system CheB/CheR fusion protein
MVKKIPRRSKHPAKPARTAPQAEEHPDAEKKAPSRPPPESAAQKQQLFSIVGVGASAGGLEAFTAFLKHVPSDSGMAFVLIQHLDPIQPSQLTDLLAKATRMPVLEVNADTPVEPNHVYVIAPGVSLSMSDGHLRAEERASGRHLPIDYFLQSLASDNTSKAIGIILSGTASDGTLGLKAVKAEGGITFAQEPSSAKFDGMPRSAIAAGVVDFVLSPEEIAKRLVRLAQHPYVAAKAEDDGQAALQTDSALNRIFHLLRSVTGNDFTHYKYTTIRRRIHRRMVLHGSEKPDDYIAYLQKNPAEARALADDLLICVTSFFREPEALEALAARVFPEILKGRSPENAIRVWVAGCATGEEAYSVAICLTEFLERSGANVPFKIFASDISERAVEKARAGIYGMPALADVSPGRLKRFFVKANGGFQIAKSIRESCIFARQNIAKDPPFHNLDLITCCNVLIYFGPVLQRKALATFHYALKPGGFLMLGPSESVGPLSHAFSPLDKKLRLYSKQPVSGPLNRQILAIQPEAGDSGAAAAGGQSGVALDVQKTAERMLLAQYAPAGVIVDDALNVVHVRGDTGAYLQVAAGEPTYSVLKMAREGLAVALRTALLKAREKKAAVSQQVAVRQNGQLRDVHLKVVPINGTGGGTGRADALHFMVLFDGAQPASPPVPAQEEAEGPKAAANGPVGAKTADLRGGRENARLKQELGATKEYLQAIIEEQEASSEELKSSNEEAQASNEELETAKEELQSANEELNTVNDELKTRNAALTEVNNDLTNVLTGINVPLVMVGRDLKIRRFTPSMEPMLNLIDSDIGRPISDLKPNIGVPDLPELLRGVVSGGSPAVREIEDPKGRWYSLQASPYRVPDNKVDGALLVLLDIDAIKRSRDFAEAIVETVRQPLVVLTRDLRIQTVNQAFYDAFKVLKEETENRLIYDLGNGQWNIPQLRQALENVLPKAGEFRDFEVTHEFQSIGRKTMLLSAREIEQPLPYGRTILLAIEDITERRQAQEAQQQRLAWIVESSDDAIISKDMNGIIQTWNRGAERIFGYTAGEAVGRNISMLTPPGRDDDFPNIRERISRGESIDRYQARQRAKDGRILFVSLTVSPLRDAAGSIIGASKIARDITEEKLAEGRIRQLNEDLKHFAYAASHDLQEPLRMVTSYTQLLAREYKDKLGTDADQFIAYAVEGAQRMEDLLKGMREYWQASERGEEHHAAADCNEILKKALLNLQKTITDSGAVVTHKPLPTIRADEVALVQLFQNLIGNAIKYRSKKPPRVDISAGKNGKEEWVFSVKDNGIGIAPQYAEKVFSMFNRLNGRKYPGSGIGLAICRKVVERLGGRIWVESEKGRGADFKFTIPPMD